MGLLPAASMDGGAFYRAAEAAGLGTDIGTLNRIVAGVNQGMTPEQAAQQIQGKGRRMGLLDNMLGSSVDDPKTLGLLQLASSLSSGQKFVPALSQGLLGRAQIIGDAKRQEAVQQIQAMQLAQMQRQAKAQEMQDAFRASIPSPQMAASQSALAGGGGPTVANAAAMPQVDPQAQLMHGALQAGLMSPTDYIASQRKDNTPMKLGAGEALIDPKTFKPIFTNPKEDTTPADWKLYQLSGAKERGISFDEWDQARKRAGATNLSVSMDKGFGTTFAEQAAKDLAASRDKARGAANTIGTLNNIDRIVGTGNVATGPTQPFQVFGMQIADTLGIGGKNNAEKLANTRQVIQGAANLALDGAARMAGQGQITEGERALIGRAAGGDIDRMTAPEIKALTGALRKVNGTALESHKSLLRNVGPQFKQFTPFYEVADPPAADNGWSIKPIGGK